MWAEAPQRKQSLFARRFVIVASDTHFARIFLTAEFGRGCCRLPIVISTSLGSQEDTGTGGVVAVGVFLR